MSTLNRILKQAVADGLIGDAQVGGLEAHLVRNGVRIETAEAQAQSDAGGEIVDTEAPRFIRGFHDVLITLGILILLAGVWGIGSVLALLPVIVVLAEIVVARQRLALPAVVLSLATILWTVFTTMAALDGLKLNPEGIGYLLALLLPLPLVMGLFYWRYRIPIALSILLLSVFSFLLTGLIYLLGRATGSPDFVMDFPYISASIFLLSAIGLFSVAMRYDLSDPVRATRRSDIAFWLHLAAAPALLYAMMSFIFLGGGGGIFSLDRYVAYDSAAKVLAIVVVLMAIGLIIDRRAFVTSGLISLIAAIFSILNQNALGSGSVIFVALLVVGLVVLSIGVGWPWLRRLVLGGLPENIKAKLPPLR